MLCRAGRWSGNAGARQGGCPLPEADGPAAHRDRDAYCSAPGARRRGGFNDVILHVAFSPDGRWLVATSAQGVGVHVVDTATWHTVFVDKTYGAESYGAVFAPDGRLFTVAYDGKLRRYSAGPSFHKEA